MRYYIREACESDLPYLIENVRHDDRLESELATGLPFGEALSLALKTNPDAKVVIVGDKPEAIFGCQFLPDRGVPWFVATERAFLIKTQFLRTSRTIVNDWASKVCLLDNYVCADNKTALTWLKFLGFKWHERVQMGGREFIHFRNQ